MRIILAFCSFYFFFNFSNAQNLIWSEDFSGGTVNWNMNILSGFNGADDPNIWVINDNEGGVVPPGCGVANNGNNTLHVTCQGLICNLLGASGAVYNAGGIGDVTTDVRSAYSSPISTIGHTNLEYRFNWIGVGQANLDFAVAEYSIDGGTTWNVIWTQSPGATCLGGQGQWIEQVISLPVSAENQSDLRFAFRWRNNNDGIGSDPSFAVDDLRLFTLKSGPTADFSVMNTTICEGDCIDFTDNSTGVNLSNWSWNFGGGAVPNTSNAQNPSNICFTTLGNFNVELTVADDNGTDNIVQVIDVISCASGPTAQFSLPADTVCIGDCINFQDNSVGNNISSWLWDFGGGAVPDTTSNANPSNVCFDSPGNFLISLTVTDENGSDQTAQTIIVEDCLPNGVTPVAAFGIDGLTCSGECIDFLDNSLNFPTSWEWTFEGGNPSFSNSQHPQNICFDAPGNYNVSLTVSNEFGSQTVNEVIQINALPSITVFSDTTIAAGGSANLQVFTTSVGTLSWSPLDGLDCSDCAIVDASPTLPTIYTVTITDANGCSNSDSVFVNIDFEENIGVPSAFSPNGDNFNDILFVKGEGIQTMVFRVFNRYGQLVFTSTDQSIGWDGKMNGNDLNQGVFVYTLEYTLFNGINGSLTGNITLIR
ncbi:MAG: PKD domain-containing protein [Crocinitomicaceae bacterium]|nr:PKD domain-containing protein [Crocinitomicaceae bacterium]